MKKDWLVKTLALCVVVLFICVSFQPVFAVENQTSVNSNQNEKNKSYVDPNIHLTRTNLPILKRSFNYFRNSNYYDVEIGKIMEQIIKLIEFKGSINSKDVEDILKDNEISSINIYTNCKIVGYAIRGFGTVFPLTFIGFLIICYYIIGIGQFLYWMADYHKSPYGYTDINITVDSKIYTNPHRGFAFGFFGSGYVQFPFPNPNEGDVSLDIRGRSLIAFVLAR